MSLQQAVYTCVAAADGKAVKKTKKVHGACLSAWNYRMWRDYKDSIIIHPKSSFPRLNLKTFKECLRILREIMPVGTKIPYLKDAKNIWKYDKWEMPFTVYNNMEVYIIFCVLRYPQEKPNNWGGYKALWESKKYTSRYLCYLTSMLGYFTKSRSGEMYSFKSSILGGGHCEFTTDVKSTVMPALREALPKWKHDGDSGLAWMNCQAWTDRLGNEVGRGTRLVSLIDLDKFDLHQICSKLHEMNGMEVVVDESI